MQINFLHRTFAMQNFPEHDASFDLINNNILPHLLGNLHANDLTGYTIMTSVTVMTKSHPVLW